MCRLLKKICILSLLLFYILSGLSAQKKDIKYSDSFLKDFVSRNWTASDGIPGNTINAVVQDDSGYIYIGTYDGLVRFDGIKFEIIDRSYNPSYEFVSARSLLKDSSGNIWIGSNDEGLFCIKNDKSTLKYTNQNGIPSNSIRDIIEDKDGNIWVGTSGGIAYVNKENKVIIPEGIEEFEKGNLQVLSMYCDTAGRIWICTNNKEIRLLCFSNGKFEIFSGLRGFEKSVVSSVSQDFTGALWFGICPHYAVKLDGNNQIEYDIGHEIKKGTIVSDIFQDHNSNMWFALDTGITVIHNGELSYFDQDSGLADDKINNIMEDREGNIWIGTDRGGLEKLSLSCFKTTSMHTSINCIAEDTYRKVVWLGGDDGLYCIENDLFVENKITNYCKNIRIRHVEITKDGALLVSTYEKFGQLKFNLNGTIESWNESNGLTGNKVRVAHEVSNGDLYIGTTEGLNIVDKDSGTITKITKESGLINDYIMCLYEDIDGSVWCGTDGGGIFVIKNGVIDRYYSTDSGLGGNVIFKIERVNSSKELWICTGKGITCYKDNKFYNFDYYSGLKTNGVFQMIEDYTQSVWMTSNRGIFCVKEKDFESFMQNKIKNVAPKYFSRSDGIKSGGATSTSLSMKDSLGRIWFALIDGFAVYDPVKVPKNQTVPLLQIQNVYLDNERYNLDGRPVLIGPASKRLTIDFTGLSFVSSEQMQFSYKLEGFDSAYSAWSDSRSVSYTNLKPGKYKFSFYTRNSDEVVSKLSEVLCFEKEPYIWQILWVKIGFVLLVANIAFFLIFTRFKRLKHYQSALEDEVDQRTHDLKVEKEKSEKLLLNILPPPIAKELSEDSNKTISKYHENVAVLFADIVDFTKLSVEVGAQESVTILKDLFTKFDERCQREGIEKIKTIGDAYMAACGLNDPESSDDCSVKMINFAKGLLKDIQGFNIEHNMNIMMRIGINSGNLVAGVIGKTKFIYDVWGDTVNVASRMESTGLPGLIHVTEATYLQSKDNFNFTPPAEIQIKGKGLMKTYYVELHLI